MKLGFKFEIQAIQNKVAAADGDSLIFYLRHKIL